MTRFYTHCRVYLLAHLAFLLSISLPLHAQRSGAGSFERAGMTIDREEQIYFGLFPSIDDFESAQLRHTEEGGLEITIDRQEDAPDTTILLQPTDARNLHTWIDELEAIYSGDQTIDFTTLPRIIRPSAPFESQSPLDVTLRDGATYTGEVLIATDSVLVLWPLATTYRWRDVDRLAIAFPVAQIQRIDKREPFYYGLGAGIIVGGFSSLVVQNSTEGDRPILGILALLIPPVIGGYVGNQFGIDAEIDGDHDAYRDLLGTLVSKARFFSAIPSEIRRLVDRTTAAPFAPPATIASLRSTSQLDPPPGFHIGGGIGNASANILAPYVLYTSSRSAELKPIVGARIMYVEGAFSILERMQVGGGYTKVQNTSTEPDEDNKEYLDIALVQAFVDLLIFTPSDRLFPNFEVAVGITAIRSQSTARGHLTSPYIGSTLDTSYSSTSSGLGFGTRLRVGYHLFRHVSIEIGVQQFQYSTGRVPEAKVNSTIGIVRRISEHETDITSISTRAGLRVHF